MKKNGNGYNPSIEQKQPIESDRFRKSQCYNYGIMNEKIRAMDSGFVGTLISIRSSKGISAREMSLSLGQSPGYINDIENGKAFPSMQMFFLICDYLDITPVDYFQFALDYNGDILGEIMKIVQKLPKADQIILLRVAERLRMK